MHPNFQFLYLAWSGQLSSSVVESALNAVDIMSSLCASLTNTDSHDKLLKCGWDWRLDEPFALTTTAGTGMHPSSQSARLSSQLACSVAAARLTGCSFSSGMLVPFHVPASYAHGGSRRTYANSKQRPDYKGSSVCLQGLYSGNSNSSQEAPFHVGKAYSSHLCDGIGIWRICWCWLQLLAKIG